MNMRIAGPLYASTELKPKTMRRESSIQLSVLIEQGCVIMPSVFAPQSVINGATVVGCCADEEAMRISSVLSKKNPKKQKKRVFSCTLRYESEHSSWHL